MVSDICARRRPAAALKATRLVSQAFALQTSAAGALEAGDKRACPGRDTGGGQEAFLGVHQAHKSQCDALERRDQAGGHTSPEPATALDVASRRFTR